MLTLDECSPAERELLDLPLASKRSVLWRLLARPTQLPPDDPDWLIWMMLSGRGAGKTRAAGEDTAAFMREHPATRVAIVAPTFAVGRDVCVEGESGLLNSFGGIDGQEIAYWNRSEGVLVLRNNAHAKVFSASQPERLRGPQHHRAWCEELAAWPYLQDTWDMLMFGLRLGQRPRCVVSSTPKPYRLVKDLASRPLTRVTRDSTFANAENLSPIMLEELQRRYGGTMLGRQELHGEIIDDVEGALWRRSEIEEGRREAPENFDKLCVAVDPAATDNPDSDETGIVVAGRLGDDGYVLQDLSRKAAPEVWAAAAVQAYIDFEADALVVERNNGGDMVAGTVRNAAYTLGIDPRKINIKEVWASRNKRTRAEPIAVMYTEQGGSRMHHVQALPDLEDQMCTWVPGEKSPDRMDALVWAATWLMDDGGRRKLRYSG